MFRVSFLIYDCKTSSSDPAADVNPFQKQVFSLFEEVKQISGIVLHILVVKDLHFVGIEKCSNYFLLIDENMQPCWVIVILSDRYFSCWELSTALAQIIIFLIWYRIALSQLHALHNEYSKSNPITFKLQNDLSSKFLAQPQPRLCTMLDLLWTFLDEAALCDILEHCIVRECLLFDLVSPVSVLLKLFRKNYM